MSYGQEQPPYGPQTRAVRRFLERLSRLDAREWVIAARAYQAMSRDPAAAGADGALAAAFERTGREAARDAAVGPLVQLARAATAAAAAGPATAGVEDDALAEVALAAALALIVRDALSADDFMLMYAPFAELIPLATLEGER
jgi:hypothetical protein